MNLRRKGPAFVLVVAACFCAIAVVFAQSSPQLSGETDAAYVERLELKKQLDRQERDKIERGAISDSLWRNGQEILDLGVRTVDELSVLTAVRDLAKML